MEILSSLGLEPMIQGDIIECRIPPHRPDLTREVDLIEEVARIYGYDKIPVGGAVTHEVRPPARLEASRRAAGEVLTAAGYYEAITFTFIDDEEAALFGWDNSLAVDRRLRKTNGILRQGLLPSLLRARKTNQDVGNEDVRLFELSAVFPPADGGTLPAEYTQLGMISDGSLQDLRGRWRRWCGDLSRRRILKCGLCSLRGCARHGRGDFAAIGQCRGKEPGRDGLGG